MDLVPVVAVDVAVIEVAEVAEVLPEVDVVPPVVVLAAEPRSSS